MNLWYREKHTENQILSVKVTDVIHKEKTPFQELAVYETPEYGTILVLDNYIQVSDQDEYIYAEMITHVPLFTHPNPKKALVIGGGDGSAIREIVKHPSIEEAHLCEIDERVVEVSKKYFPQMTVALEDPKVKILYKDGIKQVFQSKDEYDLIVVDSPDPVGPAVNLFSKGFYEGVYEALKEDGIMVAQTESPYFNQDVMKKAYDDISALFPITKVYMAAIPTYQSGFWTFTMGSKKYDPTNVENMRKQDFETSYYNQNLHYGAFLLPTFIQNILEGK